MKRLLTLILLLVLGGCVWHSSSEDLKTGPTTQPTSVQKRTLSVGVFKSAPPQPLGKSTITPQGGVESEGIEGGILSGPTGLNLLYTIGSLMVVAGLVAVGFFKQYWTGGAIALGGIILISIAVLFETYPWVSWLIVVVALAGAGWYFYKMYKGNALKTTAALLNKALKQTVAGFQKVKELIAGNSLAPDTLDHVKAAMKGEQDEDVSDLVDEKKVELKRRVT